MKKCAAFVLSIFMITALFLPLQVFAEGDNGLEQALKIVKGTFDIPSDMTEFNYNVYSQGDGKVWELDWSSKDDLSGSIHVSVNEQGKIINYYFNKPYDYSKKKLPKVSKQDAKAAAEDFLKKVNPQALDQVKLVDNNTNYPNNETYFFSFIRVVNGIPFYNNYANVEVNRESGDVQNYNTNWNEEIQFPGTDKVISLEQAQTAFKDKLGLKLIYNDTFDGKMKIYPAYTLKYPYNFYLDALTGEKIQTEPGYYPYADGNEKADATNKKAYPAAAGKVEVVLTPDELKAVEKVSKLLSKEEVEKIARGLKILDLTDDLKLVNANLSRDWQFRDDFNWYLNFQKEGKADGSDFRSASVTINAITGEVKGFYTDMNVKSGDKAKYDEASAKAAVENFLKDFKQDKFNQTEYDDSDNDYLRMMGKETPAQFSFNYVRKVNGIQFPGNSLRVDYDAVNGKVIGFQMNWFNVDFPSIDKAISIGEMYDKLFTKTGLELQYKADYNYEAYEKIRPVPNNAKVEVKLVYDIKRDKPLTFDAYTGTILDYNGEAYKEIKPVEYTDISGHYAEKQIIALAEYGISLDGTQFRPDEDITQKDFLKMLSKISNNYNGPVISSGDKDIDQIYTILIRGGVVKESEKAPDAVVTREEGVKFLIRALKYDKVADIKGIFKTSFKDEDQINPDLIGYVTIAQGLKLVSGHDGFFNPKDKLTRAQTAIIIYNYLQN